MRRRGLLAVFVLLAGCGKQPYALRGRHCGTSSQNHTDEVPAVVAPCFVSALAAGDSAHVKLTFASVEGDPILQSYQVTGRGRFDLVFDTRKDKFGPREVRLFRCEAL